MSLSDRFLLLGVGGAGGRIANQVAQATGGRLRAAAIDTDFAAVAQLGLCQQTRIGRSRFDGLGAGGNATAARMAADEDSDALRKLFADASLAVVITGLGGGTGSGATPAVLRVARDLNVRTLVFATLPFAFEGAERRALANRTCPLLEEAGDVLVVAENDDLCADTLDQPAPQAFAAAARHLAAGLTLLWKLTSAPGYIRLDYATLSNLLLCGRGRATFAYATAQGDRRFELALADLLDHPRRGIRKSLGGAPAMLVGVLGGEDLRLKEIGDTMARLQMEVDADCDVRMGTVLDPDEAPALSLATLLFHSWVRDETEAPAEPTPATRPTGVEATPRLAPRPRRGRSQTAPLVGDRFKSTHATVFAGEDLDVPAYLRRGLRIDAG